MFVEKHVEDAIARGTWIFLGSLAISLTGFVFWLIIARIAGAESVGIASAVVSSSMIAATLVAAGMNVAVVREVAARGVRAFTASLTLASIAGIVASALTIPFIHALGYQDLALIASLLAISSTISIALLFSLIGFEKFRSYFLTVLTSSLAKLLIGVVLAILGFKILTPLIGYLSYPIVASIVALILLASSISFRGSKPGREELKSLAVLTFSNYPYMFSNQLLTMLSVYIFAYLVREAVPTGTLYIALMITLAITAIPNSILSAVLPIETRRNTNPFTESFRIGLALATPVIVAVASAPTLILKTINPELAQGASTLMILLLLSIAPLAALTTAITKSNKEGQVKNIVVIGVSRLILLIVLLPPLTGMLGIQGAALAFLTTNILLIPLALRIEPLITKPLLTLWSIQITLTILLYTTPLNELIKAIGALTLTPILMHTTNIFTISELHNTLKTIISTISHKP